MSAYHTYSEAQLVACLQDSDHRAFTEIYNRYWEVLADIAYQRLHSREDAEEVVQEVFVNLYIRRKELSLTTTLEGYLKRALKYKVIDAYRLQQRYFKHLDHLMEEQNIEPPIPDQQIEFKELRERVFDIANKLSDKCRDAFVLSRFEHLSHQEIAERMDISVSTVKKHINKALQLFRNDLGSNNLHVLVIGLLLM